MEPSNYAMLPPLDQALSPYLTTTTTTTNAGTAESESSSSAATTTSGGGAAAAVGVAGSSSTRHGSNANGGRPQQPIDYSDWIHANAHGAHSNAMYDPLVLGTHNAANVDQALGGAPQQAAGVSAAASPSSASGSGSAYALPGGAVVPELRASRRLGASSLQHFDGKNDKSALLSSSQHLASAPLAANGSIGFPNSELMNLELFRSDTFPPHPLQQAKLNLGVVPQQAQRQQSLQQKKQQQAVTRSHALVPQHPLQRPPAQSSSSPSSSSPRQHSPARHISSASASGPPASSAVAPPPPSSTFAGSSSVGASSKKAAQAVAGSFPVASSPAVPAVSPPMTRSGSRSSPTRAAAAAAAASAAAASEAGAEMASPSTTTKSSARSGADSTTRNTATQAPSLTSAPPQVVAGTPEPSTSTRSRRSLGAPVAARASGPEPVVIATPAATKPSSARASRSKAASTPSKAPQEPDAEAALHLLRLAQPDGSTMDEDLAAAEQREDPADNSGIEEDAEGESDASSVHSLDEGSAKSTSTKATTVGSAPPATYQKGGRVGSATARARRGRLSNESTQSMGSPRLDNGSTMLDAMDGVEGYAAREWHFSDDAQLPPIRLPLPEYPSRAPSLASSTASASRGSKSHRPARIQREAAAAAAAAALADEASPSTRRTSGRARKPILSSVQVASDDDDDDSDVRSAYEDDGADAEEAMEGASDSDGGPKRTGKRGVAAKGKGQGNGKGKARASTASKRDSEIGASSLNPTPAKKPRTSTSSYAGSVRADTPGSTISTTSTTRRARRQPVVPTNLVERSFPPGMEKEIAMFPRFYRAFPISSAFPPDSFVHRGTGLPAPTSASSGVTAANSLASSSNVPALTLPQTSGNAQASTSTAMAIDETLSPAVTSSAANGEFVLPTFPNAPQTTHTPPATTLSFLDCPAGAKWNKGADPFNIYMPRFVRGSADVKEGLCPVCVEPVARGGEGEERWLKLKNSSYVYHMSYAHGLSNLTGLPFSPPTQFRTRLTGAKTKDAREEMVDGMCHKCNEWIPLLSVKRIETVVPELIWWKHAKKCHGETKVAGEGEYYVRDAMYDFVAAKKATHGM